MTRVPSASVRKVPQQARSRATVERLRSAARTVLERDGYEGFSTNRVAAEAQLSVGSLYQYFPDKLALAEAVIERWVEEVSDRVAGTLTTAATTGGRDPAAVAADALVEALESDEALLRLVWEELPGARNADRRRALERRISEQVLAFLSGRGARLPDPPATAWVLVVAIEHVAVRWVLDRPPIPRAAVVAEMAALGRGLLRDPRG